MYGNTLCLFTGFDQKKSVKAENNETRNCERGELHIDVPDKP